MKNNSIAKIVKECLCCGCGICTMICHKHAISMERNVAGFIVSSIDNGKCVNCGKCLGVCPKGEILQIRYGKKEAVDQNAEIKKVYNHVKGGYLCHSADEAIRKSSQSGGAVTAILQYMIDHSIIDEAYINQFENNLNTNKMVKAVSLDDLIRGAGSYYSQSSIEKCIGHDNSAAVVLGCQSTGLKRLEKEKTTIPKYLIGLFCGGNFSGKYYEKLEGKYRNDSVEQFRFRDKKYGGWPGNVSFSVNGMTVVVDKSVRMKEKEAYLCSSCDYCKERINSASDLAVGDPWGIFSADVERGYSVILTYTKQGDDIVKNAIKDGYIVGKEIPHEAILKGQDVNIEYYVRYKKRVANEVGKRESIRLRLRKRVYRSSNIIGYQMNLFVFRAYEQFLQFARLMRRR